MATREGVSFARGEKVPHSRTQEMSQMKRIAAAMLAVLVAGPVVAEEGMALGTKVPAFYVTDVTGPSAGEKLCYRCRYGARPVVSIFVREVNDEVGTLVKQIDEKVGANKDAGMAAFVVLLTENPEADSKKLKELAEKNGIKNTPLTTFDGKVGPAEYKVGQNSEVTVMMWNKSELKVNDVLSSKDLSKDKVTSVVGKTSTILN